MTCFGYWWWVFPLMFLGMMILLSVSRARRGWRGWCFPSGRRGDHRGRIDRLEEQIKGLKDHLADLGVRAPYR